MRKKCCCCCCCLVSLVFSGFVGFIILFTLVIGREATKKYIQEKYKVNTDFINCFFFQFNFFLLMIIRVRKMFIPSKANSITTTTSKAWKYNICDFNYHKCIMGYMCILFRSVFFLNFKICIFIH